MIATISPTPMPMFSQDEHSYNLRQVKSSLSKDIWDEERLTEEESSESTSQDENYDLQTLSETVNLKGRVDDNETLKFAYILVSLSTPQEMELVEQLQASEKSQENYVEIPEESPKQTHFISYQKKKRHRTSPYQLEILENTFSFEQMPNQKLRHELADKLQMSPRRVQIWFQNKRAKVKRGKSKSSSSSSSSLSMLRDLQNLSQNFEESRNESQTQQLSQRMPTTQQEIADRKFSLPSISTITAMPIGTQSNVSGIRHLLH